MQPETRIRLQYLSRPDIGTRPLSATYNTKYTPHSEQRLDVIRTSRVDITRKMVSTSEINVQGIGKGEQMQRGARRRHWRATRRKPLYARIAGLQRIARRRLTELRDL
jgi:hypothetical protein